jgi:hypothetical protein
MQKHGDPPAAIVEEIGGSVQQAGLFPSARGPSSDAAPQHTGAGQDEAGGFSVEAGSCLNGQRFLPDTVLHSNPLSCR